MKSLLQFISIFVCTGLCSQTYYLNGDAIATGVDCYQLTTEATYQNGTVWYAEQISVWDFDISFVMNFGDIDANGADGMCFVLQTVGTSAIGETGGGMGYLNFDNSFAIEFDTWQNAEYGDPIYDHIAMEINGDINHTTPLGNVAGPVQMSALSANVEDGEDHIVRITCDQGTGEIAVYFDCELRLTGIVNLIANVFDGEFMAYWGFTGATGGSFNVQTVCLQENIISTGANVSICTGATTQLSASGDPNGTYLWSPPDNLDDPTSPTPIANPPVTTIYTVNYSDLCGETITDSVTVTVEDLEVELPETATLTCADTLLFLQGVSNFFNDINYLWTTDYGELGVGQGTENMGVSAPGAYTLAITYNNQCFAAAQTLVSGDFQFDVTATSSGIINCINETVNISAVSGIPGTTFSWSTSDGNIFSGNNSATAIADAPGTYFVQGYLNENCNGANSVEVIADFSTYLADAGNDAVLNCYADEVILDGMTDGSDALVIWTTSGGNIVNGSSSLNPLVDENDTYTLTITNPTSGCTTSDEATVTSDFEEPQISIALPDTLNCVTPSVEISGVDVLPADANYGFQWTTDDGEISSGANTVSPTIVAEGEYNLLVTNIDNGCTAIGDVEVFESDVFNLDLSQLRFPNIISPNTDGKNEFWQPFLASEPEFDVTQVFSEYSFKAYNRWGKIIFESDDNTRKWTDREIVPGTYYYILHYSSSCGNGASGNVEGYVEVVK